MVNLALDMCGTGDNQVEMIQTWCGRAGYWWGGILMGSVALGGEPEPGLELGLLLDSSGSVSVEDFSARNRALAAALHNPFLTSAIDSSGKSLVFGVYQFSGPGQVGTSLDWRLIDDASSARATSSELATLARLFAGGAEVDSALVISSLLAAGNPLPAEPTHFVVIGDGATTATGTGRDFALAGGVESISAWVLGNGPDLDSYLAGVVGGDGSGAVLGEPDDFGRQLGQLLFRHFQNPDNTAMAASAGLGQAVLEASRMAFTDLNARLTRLRAGVDSESPESFRIKWPAGSKSAPQIVPPAVRWTGFGDLHAGWQDGAASYGSAFGIPVLAQAAHELRYEAVTAGVEAGLPGGWAAGAAWIAQHSDIDLDRVGDAEDDALGAAIYVSHSRPLPFAGLTFHGDVMAGFLDHEVELDRRTSTGLARGDTSARTAVLDLNFGAQRTDHGISHGPDASLGLLRGDIDAFREVGAARAVHPSSDFSSTRVEFGYHGAIRVNLASVPVTFSARGAWQHEFEDGRVTAFGAELAGQGEDALLIETGIRATVAPNVRVHASLLARVASQTDAQQLNLGVEVSF